MGKYWTMQHVNDNDTFRIFDEDGRFIAQASSHYDACEIMDTHNKSVSSEPAQAQDRDIGILWERMAALEQRFLSHYHNTRDGGMTSMWYPGEKRRE